MQTMEITQTPKKRMLDAYDRTKKTGDVEDLWCAGLDVLSNNALEAWEPEQLIRLDEALSNLQPDEVLARLRMTS